MRKDPRFSDRPTKRGGPFIWLATMMFSFFGGGFFFLLGAHYFVADKIGKAYFFVMPPIWHPINGPVFLIGGALTVYWAIKIWGEATPRGEG
jgi:hypothetical protein